MISPSEAGRYATTAVIVMAGGFLYGRLVVWAARKCAEMQWENPDDPDFMDSPTWNPAVRMALRDRGVERINDPRKHEMDEDSYELGDDAAPNYALYKKAHESTDDPPPKRVA